MNKNCDFSNDPLCVYEINLTNRSGNNCHRHVLPPRHLPPLRQGDLLNGGHPSPGPNALHKISLTKEAADAPRALSKINELCQMNE